MLAVDLNAERLASLAGSSCETLVGDVTDPAIRGRLADWATDADYLVNAAGIIVIKPIFEVTVEDWRRVQTVNAESIFFLCQAIGPRLRPGGAIVNLSSISAKLATTVEVAAYGASKTTILSITRSFAYALASRPVRVNAICRASSIRRCRSAFSRGGADARPQRRGTPTASETSRCRSGAAHRPRNARD